MAVRAGGSGLVIFVTHRSGRDPSGIPRHSGRGSSVAELPKSLRSVGQVPGTGPRDGRRETRAEAGTPGRRALGSVGQTGEGRVPEARRCTGRSRCAGARRYQGAGGGGRAAGAESHVRPCAGHRRAPQSALTPRRPVTWHTGAQGRVVGAEGASGPVSTSPGVRSGGTVVISPRELCPRATAERSRRKISPTLQRARQGAGPLPRTDAGPAPPPGAPFRARRRRSSAQESRPARRAKPGRAPQGRRDARRRARAQRPWPASSEEWSLSRPSVTSTSPPGARPAHFVIAAGRGVGPGSGTPLMGRPITSNSAPDTSASRAWPCVAAPSRVRQT